MQTFFEFIDQSFDFPPEGFQVLDDELYFHGINVMELIETYKTPLRFTYMPIISERVRAGAEVLPRRDRQGRLPWQLYLHVLHEERAFQTRDGRGAQSRGATRNVVGSRYPDHRRPRTFRPRQQTDPGVVQRIQRLRVQAKHRGHAARRLRKLRSDTRQQRRARFLRAGAPRAVHAGDFGLRPRSRRNRVSIRAASG